MSRFVVGAAIFACVFVLVPDASATVMVSGAGNGLSSSASFTISGSTLTILLTNTDTSPKGAEWLPTDVLTGLFFNLGSSSDVFTPVSATATTGLVQSSQCTVGPCDSTTKNVGGEWSYAFGGVADTDLAGANRGISSGGYLNANTGAGNFGGANLDRGETLNGINFGIAPDAFTEGSGIGGLDVVPLVKGSATFVLNIPKGLTEAMISNVYFQYGTNLNKPSFTTTTTNGSGSTSTGSIPEPSILALVYAGFALAGCRRLLRRRV